MYIFPTLGLRFYAVGHGQRVRQCACVPLYSHPKPIYIFTTLPLPLALGATPWDDAKKRGHQNVMGLLRPVPRPSQSVQTRLEVSTFESSHVGASCDYDC